MKSIIIKSNSNLGISEKKMREVIEQSIEDRKMELKHILIIPPDHTRSHSQAGLITSIYYDILKDNCQIDIMPALGTHTPMNEDQLASFFGTSIPKTCFLPHNWRKDVVKIGEIPKSFVHKVSNGLLEHSIDVEINKKLLDKKYDLIISIGQVVPHEVVGMANYSKNIFVGCGGKSMIDKSHMLGAVYGMEKIMGHDKTPVRQVFDYAEESFISEIPIMYLLTVTTTDINTKVHGLFLGRDREIFEEAVKLSQIKNIEFLNKPLKRIVVNLPKEEFKSTWLGNKAIYRTRMAIEDCGELIVLAPGVKQFGEDANNNEIIKKYGYLGRKKILELFRENEDLKNNQAVTAHLIHGSSDNRFKITYAVNHLDKKEVERVNFNYMSYGEAKQKYDPSKLKEGFNILDNGEEIFYISNPALGLWAAKDKFFKSN